MSNEDAYAIFEPDASPGSALYVVCDGVSTAGGGQLAANVACERLEQFFDADSPQDLPQLTQLVSEIDWELRGLGKGNFCTLSAVWLVGERAHVITIGDSPVFRARGGRLTAARSHRSKGRRLESYVGMGPVISEAIHHSTWHLRPGDRLLLMSDGASNTLGRDGIVEICQREHDIGVCVREMVAEVARLGVDDDATVLGVELQVPDGTVSPAAPDEAPDPPPGLFSDEG